MPHHLSCKSSGWSQQMTQVEENCGAMQFGSLTQEQMQKIDQILDRIGAGQ